MSKLLVIGAINTDLIAFVDRAPRAGETVAGGSFENHGGGKASNQAVAAARSHAKVALLSAVGADDFGQARTNALKNEGVDISGVATIDDVASGVAIIIVEETGENRICDLPGAREHLSPEYCQKVFEQAESTAILSANELSLDCQRAIFELAHRADIPIWFNVAPYSDQARELLPFVDTLILNQGEAEDILDARDQNRSVQELARGLRSLGVKRVVMTLGAEGVRGFEGETEFAIPAESVEVVDTTGAGDTFCGAWAAEMVRGAMFADALAYGNHAASISVTRRGAQSSIPTREEIEA